MTATLTVKHGESLNWFYMRRAIAQDARLTYAARGVYAYLESRDFDNVDNKELVIDGFTEDDVKQALQMLVACGYVVEVEND